jgi:hypothetical protein
MIRTIAFCLMVGHALAQQADPLLFQNKTHDFGNIQEREGAVQHTFNFVNNAGRTFRILSVLPSCGCTTSGWSDQPVAPGKSGFVKAAFDPTGRPGYFSKTLTVTTDLGPQPVVLTLKGNVMTGPPPANQFSVAKGTLRFRASSFNMGTVYINQAPAVKEFEVVNEGPDAVQFLSVEAPAFASLTLPKSLAAQERGVIRIQYDAKGKNQYGFTLDQVVIVTDQEMEPRLSFSLFATVQEFFPTLSGEELLRAPKLKIEPVELSAGSLRLREEKELTVRLRNVGKKELAIRSMQPNCGCLSVQAENLVIKPNAETIATVRITGEGRIGTQTKAITVYSTDPAQPVQRILLTVVIQD